MSKFSPGWYEDAAHSVILDDPAHGCHPLPLPGVGGVVVLGQLPGQPLHAGHGPAVAKVRDYHVSVLDQETRG